jgi:hypothetical protein
MDEFYLLVSARRLNGDPDTMSRVAKCSYDQPSSVASVAGSAGVGDAAWWKIEVFDNPVPSMMDVFFVSPKVDPAVRAAEVLAERFETGLNCASKHRWKVDNCGPIDAEDAALLRIELEVV